MSPDPLLEASLALFLIVVLVERTLELTISARHARALKARGAREYGAGHFPLFVFIHALFPIGVVMEVFLLGARPGSLWPLWLVLFFGALSLRFAAVHALGVFWNVRVIVLPGSELVRRGPYRFLRHPAYVAVTIELLAAPLLFGAWRTALGVAVLNAFALFIRIRVEESALAQCHGVR